MDLQAAIYIWENYGWLGILSLAFGSYVIYDRIVANKKNKKIDKLNTKVKFLTKEVETLEEKVDTVHEKCHVPQNSIKKLYQKIEDLEKTDLTMDGDFKAFKAEIKAEMQGLRDGQTGMQNGIDNILGHLLNR